MRQYPVPVRVAVYLAIVAWSIEIAEAFFGFDGVNLLNAF